MIGAKIIAQNMFFLTLASVVNMFISIATTSIIARSIGPELYGRYTFGLTYVMMFSIIANLGLESIYIREAARDQANLRLIKDIFHLKIVLAVTTIISILLSAYALNYPPETITVLYILCVGLLFQILSESLLSVYRSVEKMHVTAFFSTFFRVVTATIIGLSVYFEVGFYGIVAAFSIGNALVFFAVFILFRHDFKLISLQINPLQWIFLVKHGTPFYISALLTMLYGKINIIILSKLVTDQEMGFYMAALTLVENLYFIPTAFLTSIFPAFSRLYGTSHDALMNAYVKIFKYLIILAVAVTVGTILVSEKIVFLIFGNHFAPSVSVLNIVIFVWVLNFISNTQSILLWAVQREKLQAKIMLIAVLISVILNFIFINVYGYIGAALAMVLTEGFIVALLTVLLWRLEFRYIPDLRTLRIVFVAAGMILLVNFLLPFNLIAAIVAGAISYTGLLFIMNVFDHDDIIYLKSLLNRKPAQ